MTDAPFESRLDYIRHLFAAETPLMQEVRAAAAAENQDNISLHPEEGKLLCLLTQLAGAKKIVEIGTFYGYSALWLLQALPEDGRIWSLEKDAARAARARSFLSGDARLTLLEGDALARLSGIEGDGPFDMVFIDADKLSYARYLDWAERHVRKGGLIVGDNTFLFDAVWKDGPVERVRETARAAMRDFNRRLADPARYQSIMLATGEGLTVARKLF
jgi:predicted O-methyltransferase YrrM